MRKLCGSALAAVALVLALSTAGSAVAAGVPVEPGRAKPQDFEPASACGCHTALVEQWTVSMHAQALNDPVYVAKLEEAEKALPALGGFCRKCHAPAATMTGEIGKAEMSAGVAGGISCSFCHQVTGNHGKPANTSQLVAPDGTRRAQIKDPEAPHKAAYSAFHETSAFCGGCHNVDHPINGMHLESTYTEWEKSPYAKEGTTCQDCHMSRGPGVVGPSTGTAAPGAKQRDNIYSMTFTGANVELADPNAATAMLKSAATMELDVPDVVGAEGADVTVTITNVGAGHYLPTGLTEVREMWLEVYAEDAAGKKIPIGERRFGTVLEDDAGKAPVELWEATKIKSDDRIAPRASVTESYGFTMPSGIESTKITAALLYRSAGDELAQKAGVKNPVTEMAVASADTYATEEAKRSASRQDVNPGTVRDWWTLGFALVGLGLVFAIVVIYWVKARRDKIDG